MKSAILVLFSLFACTAHGQRWEYPVLKSAASAISDFGPSEWVIMHEVKSDLNHDSHDDIAVIFELNRVAEMIDHADTDDTIVVFARPRILLIAFYDPATKSYAKEVQSNTFILTHEHGGNLEEPFDDMTINSNVLHIKFRIWATMGSWHGMTTAYKFRYQDGSFKLIGADYYSLHRASGEFEDRSYNFLTSKVKIIKGHISKTKETVSWKKVDVPALKTFKTFKTPFTWDVDGECTL